MSIMKTCVQAIGELLGICVSTIPGKKSEDWERATVTSLSVGGRELVSLNTWTRPAWDVYVRGPKRWNAFVKCQGERLFVGYDDGAPYSTSIMVGDARSINCRPGGWEPTFIEKRIGNVMIRGVTMTSVRRAVREKNNGGRSGYERIIAGLGPN